MKWCTLNWDKKGLFVYWSYMYGSIYDENYDNGEEYHLDIPFDWWAKSWEEAKDDFECVYHPIVLPWFMAYLFLGVQTIIHIIKRKKWYKQVRENEQLNPNPILTRCEDKYKLCQYCPYGYVKYPDDVETSADTEGACFETYCTLGFDKE